VAPAQAACLSQAEGRAGRRQRQAAAARVGSAGKGNGEILKAQLCEQGGGYVYVLSVKNGSKVTNVTVNADR
jgi:uncharacterized membrane protein YkoI